MTDRRTDIIAELETSLENSITFFRSLSPDELKIQVYQDGATWTIKQILAHFVTIERSMHWVFKDILAGGSGSPRDFDVDRFNRSQVEKLDRLTVEELIVQFKQVRGDTIAIVREMSENDLDREGWHAFHGQDRLERFICWAYEHARIHENDIRKALPIK